MKTKIIKASLVIIGIALIIFGISRMVKYEVFAIPGSIYQAKAATSAGGILAQNEKNPDTYEYNINIGTFDVTQIRSEIPLPIHGDFQIYCINPGGSIQNPYDKSLTYDDVNQLSKTEISKKSHTYDGDGEYSCAPDLPLVGETTYARYVPEIGMPKELPVAAAYIISDEPIGTWSVEKQRAIWNLGDVNLDDGLLQSNSALSPNDGPSIYDNEAKDYAKYDSEVRGKGLQPTDRTSLDSVYTKVDTKNKKYTVGPFNIEYTNGIYGNIAFAGISNMTVIGYTKNGSTKEIQLDQIILKDTTTGAFGTPVTPQYFEPDAQLKVDETEQVYPKSGQDFMIVFEDPNAELEANNENRVVEISIKVKFQYMLANGQYTKLKGTVYTLQQKHDERNYHTHGERWTCAGYKERMLL